jgi:hypothetical protein
MRASSDCPFAGAILFAVTFEGPAMPLAFTASLCLSFFLFVALPAVAQTSVSPAGVPAAADAAAKHAKRTACLKETKARKLVGAEKTAFLKSCIDAPPQPISANRVPPPDRP